MEWLIANLVPLGVGITALFGAWTTVKNSIAKLEVRLNAAESSINHRADSVSRIDKLEFIAATNTKNIEGIVISLRETQNRSTAAEVNMAEISATLKALSEVPRELSELRKQVTRLEARN
jgi:hypothetical protein